MDKLIKELGNKLTNLNFDLGVAEVNGAILAQTADLDAVAGLAVLELTAAIGALGVDLDAAITAATAGIIASIDGSAALIIGAITAGTAATSALLGDLIKVETDVKNAILTGTTAITKEVSDQASFTRTQLTNNINSVNANNTTNTNNVVAANLANTNRIISAIQAIPTADTFGEYTALCILPVTSYGSTVFYDKWFDFRSSWSAGFDDETLDNALKRLGLGTGSPITSTCDLFMEARADWAGWTPALGGDYSRTNQLPLDYRDTSSRPIDTGYIKLLCPKGINIRNCLHAQDGSLKANVLKDGAYLYQRNSLTLRLTFRKV